MNIEKIILEPQNPKEPAAAKKLRVAAYCRVSTDNEEQRTSFENQVKAYTDMIESRPDWKQRLRCDITINVRKSTCNLSRYRV